jgi:hypothetical protein
MVEHDGNVHVACAPFKYDASRNIDSRAALRVRLCMCYHHIPNSATVNTTTPRTALWKEGAPNDRPVNEACCDTHPATGIPVMKITCHQKRHPLCLSPAANHICVHSRSRTPCLFAEGTTDETRVRLQDVARDV